MHPAVFWTMMRIMWQVWINLEDPASTPYSSKLIEVTLLFLFLNALASNFKTSRGGLLIIDRKQSAYGVVEHISTKVEATPQILSSLKNETSIWIIKPGVNFDISMVITMGVYVALGKIHIGQCSSKSGNIVEIPFLCHMPQYWNWDLNKALINKLGEICFKWEILLESQYLFFG